MKKAKIFTMVLTLVAVIGFTGCSKKEVPQGYVGKIMDTNGFQEEILQPGWYHMGFFTIHKKMIYLQTSEGRFTEKVTIRMKDNMDLIADHVRVRVKVNKDPKVLNTLFNSLPAKNGKVITLNQMYQTYGNLVVTRDLREILSKYTLDDVRLNYSRIVAEVSKKIKEDFKATPLVLLDINVGRFVYPKVYNEAILQAKKKELEIKKAQAEAAIQVEKMRAKEKIAKAQYNVKMQEARRIADYNKMIGNSVSPQLLKLRQLEVQQALVENLQGNQNTVYMPLPMMNDSSFLLNSKTGK